MLQFLQKEIQLREKAETFKELSIDKVRRELPEKKKLGAAIALQTTSEVENLTCGFCQKKHKSEKCFSFLNLNRHDRQEKVREARECFNCLRRGLDYKTCISRIRCSQCN